MNDQIFHKIQNAEIIVIKVGSARVSGDKNSVNDFLYHLAGDIRSLRDKGKKVILVSSGAIAQGKTIFSETSEHSFTSRKTTMEKEQSREDKSDIGSNKTFVDEIASTTKHKLADKPSLAEKQALAALGQNKLMNLYERFFSQVNIPIAQILFGKGDIVTKEGHKNLENTFRKLLEWNILPIVNENDSISTDELNLGDNDFLSAMVASLLNANVLLILTGVDGFLRDDKLVPFLNKVEDDDMKFAYGPTGPGTGGMTTKLKAAKILLDFGIITGIVNGTKPNSVRNFFEGTNKGTIIASENFEQTSQNQKNWIERFF
ncbi:glutamate 5-kinase [Leptospira sp. GIMC2001]|uniref:glutamate 5-kinase n=1 Tax=Leptospira sp. GIMC2001 TaxID=1513297 RepID=UPI00234AECDF|nr:glutamate 5-kinase [Leptospira sp. GIMC2001]WCL47967.1 glutamate 5-kinase [Leptospira sp. GIMC2001]